MEARTKNKMERDWISAHEDLAFQQGRLDFIKVVVAQRSNGSVVGKPQHPQASVVLVSFTLMSQEGLRQGGYEEKRLAYLTSG